MSFSKIVLMTGGTETLTIRFSRQMQNTFVQGRI